MDFHLRSLTSLTLVGSTSAGLGPKIEEVRVADCVTNIDGRTDKTQTERSLPSLHLLSTVDPPQSLECIVPGKTETSPNMGINHLEKMPQEMMDSIAIVCDTASLLALRATNKRISEMMDKIFIDRHFKKRTHLYTVFGLLSLADIATSRLVKHIQEIELVSQYVHMLETAGQDKLAMWNGEGAVITIRGLGGDMLYKVLDGLRHGTCAVTFRLSTGEDNIHPYGAGTRTKQIEVSNIIDVNKLRSCPGDDCADILTALLRASVLLSKRKLPNPIRELHARYSQSDSGMESLGFTFEGQTKLPPTAWEGLRLLKFDISDNEWNSTEIKKFGSFLKSLKSAPNLESVALAYTDNTVLEGNELDWFDTLGDAMSTCRAKHLMAHIQSLKLVKVSLLYEEEEKGWEVASRDRSWHRVLDVVAKKLNLRFAELVDLHMQMVNDNYDGFLKLPFADEEGNRSYSFKGPEAVKEGFARLASTGRYLAMETEV
ncbi:hypothetical protein LTS10_004635 [Elasticomyces elasticus]|nr:hypothetical protein LTS10_004635 [Elasticomyces elasticus]